MKIIIGLKNGNPIIKIDENQECKLDYDSLFNLIDVFVNSAISEINDEPEWELCSTLTEKDRLISERYLELVKELYNECQKQDFKDAVLKANEAEQRLKDAEKEQIETSINLK